MTVPLWLPQTATTPNPGDLAGYLRQQGWSLTTVDDRWALYTREFDGDNVVLEVPQRAAAPDYGRVVRVLLQDLAQLEQRDPIHILRDVRASSVDIVRLGIESSTTRDGRISVEAGRRVYDATRDLLLAAACSVIDPRPVFAKRKPEQAMALLHRVKFGQTEIGSFVLTLECSVPPLLQSSLLPLHDDPDAPLERKTSVRLARALRATEDATRQSTAAGRIDPFRERAKDGVSANLCEAVAEILDATSAESLWAGFSFASSRPFAADVPRKVAFSSDTAVTLREAAARLRDDAGYPGVELEGTVVKLDSPDPTMGGDAVLRTDFDGRTRHVKIALGPSDYPTAIQAHGDRALVRCIGDLAREGRSWVLQHAREFATADPEE